MRKTCVKTHRKAGVARDKFRYITGHKSTYTLDSYDDGLSNYEQVMVSVILTRKDANKSFAFGASAKANKPADIIPVENDIQCPQPTYSLGPATLPLFGTGTVLNNCIFNININMAHGLSK